MENKKGISQKQIGILAKHVASLNIEQLNVLSNLFLEKALENSNRDIIFPLKVLVTVTRK